MVSYYKEIDGNIYKKCCKCGEFKLLSTENFHKGGKKTKDGYKGVCKSCRNKTINLERLVHFNSIGDLLCASCGEYKSETEYYNSNDASHIKHRKSKQRICKSCERERKRIIKSFKKEDLEFHLKNIFLTARQRSIKRGTDFEITLSDIINLYNKQNGKCAITGITMTYLLNYGKHRYNVSIDRIDSNKGYVVKNIQLVIAVVNTMKSDLTMYDFITLCNNISNYNCLIASE